MIFFALIIKCAPCHPDGSKQRENLQKKTQQLHIPDSDTSYLISCSLSDFFMCASTFYMRYCFCNWIAALMKCITAALQVEKIIQTP